MRLTYRGTKDAYMGVVNHGLTPGFIVNTDVFKQMEKAMVIDKFSVGPSQLILYLRKF